MNIFKNKNALMLLIAGLSVVGGGIFSCNKNAPNTLKDEFDGDLSSLNLGTRKAMVIVIDGAVGAEVKKMAPRNLTLLSDFAIYSYDALSDYYGELPMTPQIGWASMMTGVYRDKHEVDGMDISNGDFDKFPTFFTRLKDLGKVDKTAAFSTSQAFIDNLAVDADVKDVASSDEDTKNNAVATLENEDAISLLVVHLSDVEAAGLDGAFLSTDAGYREAVIKADAEIGELLEAMRSRKDFEKENWLVIVASGNGSLDTDDEKDAARNAFNDTRRNGLFLAYNPRFNSRTAFGPGSIIPYLGTTPSYDFNDAASKVTVEDDDGLFDFGDNGSYTIQCKVKVPAENRNYPAFLGKRARFAGGVSGWLFFFEGDYWMINFSKDGQSGNTQIKGQKVSDGQWHTLTAVIRQEGANRMVYTYTDGVYSGNSGNIASRGDLNTDSPLTIGYIPDSRSSYTTKNYNVTDVRIYNEALSAEYIEENFCKVSVNEDDPYYDNLIGFWPSTSIEGAGEDKYLPDLSGYNHPFKINKLGTVSFNDVTTQVCPDISVAVYRTVPNSVDVAAQLYTWFGVIANKNWQLDGSSWIPTYIDLNN